MPHFRIIEQLNWADQASLELTATVEGDNNVRLSPAPLTKIDRCNISPELPRSPEDFAHSRGRDGPAVAEDPEESPFYIVRL